MIETQRVQIKFSLLCESEYDNTDPENPVLVKSAETVADEATALVKNYAANQTPPGTALANTRELNADNIILEITMRVPVTSAAEASGIKTTLDNNMASLPPITDDGIIYAYTSAYTNE